MAALLAMLRPMSTFEEAHKLEEEHPLTVSAQRRVHAVAPARWRISAGCRNVCCLAIATFALVGLCAVHIHTRQQAVLFVCNLLFILSLIFLIHMADLEHPLRAVRFATQLQDEARTIDSLQWWAQRRLHCFSASELRASPSATSRAVAALRADGTCVIRGCIPKKFFWYGAA